MAIGDFTRIYTNIAAYNSLSALKVINKNLAKIQLQLATGLRINEVADDPAGFTISQRLYARTRGLSAALENIGTAKNVLSVAEGGLQNISDILLTMKEKVTQAASDTLGSVERNAIKKEVHQLTQEIDDIVKETTFNNRKLINGTYIGISFQTGEQPTNTLRVNLSQSVAAESLNVASSTVAQKVLTATGASVALENVNRAIGTVTSVLQEVGAISSRLSVKESTVETAIVNTESTRSRIRDADMARLQLEATKLQILQSTATNALVNSNLLPVIVLSLFRVR
jgi:flagellin